MKKYIYDAHSETFKRSDKRGMPLYVNIVEANRIINLVNLGTSVQKIIENVKLSNPKASVSTVRSFIKNYREDNIEIPEDAPVPVKIFDEVTEDSRVDELEKRVKALEDKMAELKPTAFAGESKSMEKGVINRIRTWI